MKRMVLNDIRELAINLVLIVLGNAEIAPGDGKIGMVVYLHDDSRRYAGLPSMITKGLAKRMA